MKRLWTKELDLTARRLYATGNYSQREIAEMLNYSEHIISRRLRMPHEEAIIYKRKMPTETKNKIIELRLQHLSYKDIAKEMNISVTTAQKYSSHLEIDPSKVKWREPVYWTNKLLAKAKALQDEGKSCYEIGKMLDLNQGAVLRHLKPKEAVLPKEKAPIKEEPGSSGLKRSVKRAITSRLREGETVQAIAFDYNIDFDEVRKFLPKRAKRKVPVEIEEPKELSKTDAKLAMMGADFS